MMHLILRLTRAFAVGDIRLARVVLAPDSGDAVSDYVLYYPWLANGTQIASSSRPDPTACNNSRKIVRDECPPYYKVVYSDEMGIWITMTSDPVHGPWTDPIEIWPVDMAHHSSHPSIAIEYVDAAGGGVPYSRLHLVWSEHIPDENQPGEIYYAYSDDGGFTWTPPENLSQSPDMASEYPSVAVDGTGVAHVVWQEVVGLSTDIFYVNNSVDGWTEPVNISAGLPFSSWLPAIASNYTYFYGTMPPPIPDDRVHVAWTEFSDYGSGATPWIAYRSYDPYYGWIPPLGSLPEDATQGSGGAFVSIVAYPSGFEVGRAAAVVWQWPYYDEDPPSSPCGIWFNQRTSGVWGTLHPSGYGCLRLPRPGSHHLPSRSARLIHTSMTTRSGVSGKNGIHLNLGGARSIPPTQLTLGKPGASISIFLKVVGIFLAIPTWAIKRV